MVKRFLTSLLRGSVRDGADAKTSGKKRIVWLMPRANGVGPRGLEAAPERAHLLAWRVDPHHGGVEQQISHREVVVFVAVRVGERVELPEQQGVLQDPLDGFDQSVQVGHQPDPIFQGPEELHLELHHLPEVSEQDVQLQHTGASFGLGFFEHCRRFGVLSVSTSSLMTLRSLSAWESCLWVATPAAGGSADTGLGGRDDEEDEEEDDTGHSGGFMSWRPRQKAATCSVLCAERETRSSEKGCHNVPLDLCFLFL
ncbi:hypothetical protein EYF80_030693 [Liparis tanakae]|uniref:Uncharacterized protein n=1 Tax=Liparis tanakae TaxID=230148 RepID=A0A4Z2GZY2_9TELE|nr:hypothetical protein EYF80_030693 [Liparis tanakae]